MIQSLRPIALACALLAVLSLVGGPAVADEGETAVLSAAIRPGWRAEADEQMAAFDLRLAPGWKTYWRAPGEAGIPPEFDWSGSENIASVVYHWPRPHVFDLNGLRTIGYKGGLLLPISFRLADPTRPATVRGRIALGVCNAVCVPVTLNLKAELSPVGPRDPMISAALADGPATGRAAGIATPRCRAEPMRDGLRLTTEIALADAAEGDFAVVEIANRAVWTAAVSSQAEGGHLIQITDLVPPEAAPFALDRSNLRTTLFRASGQVIEIDGCNG